MVPLKDIVGLLSGITCAVVAQRKGLSVGERLKVGIFCGCISTFLILVAIGVLTDAGSSHSPVTAVPTREVLPAWVVTSWETAVAPQKAVRPTQTWQVHVRALPTDTPISTATCRLNDTPIPTNAPTPGVTR